MPFSTVEPWRTRVFRFYSTMTNRVVRFSRDSSRFSIFVVVVVVTNPKEKIPFSPRLFLSPRFRAQPLFHHRYHAVDSRYFREHEIKYVRVSVRICNVVESLSISTRDAYEF